MMGLFVVMFIGGFFVAAMGQAGLGLAISVAGLIIGWLYAPDPSLRPDEKTARRMREADLEWSMLKDYPPDPKGRS